MEHQRMLEDPWTFKDFLMGINFRSAYCFGASPNRSRTQREALLHLVFPDTFEGVVSVDHKELITKAFAGFVT